MAVSYTHLDVYKRQSLEYVKQYGEAHKELNYKQVYLLEQCVVWQRSVSYTHLDVYKRQDVAGAALSTSIAMFISWIVSIVYIRKKFPEIQFTFLPRRFSGTMMKMCIRDRLHTDSYFMDLYNANVK